MFSLCTSIIGSNTSLQWYVQSTATRFLRTCIYIYFYSLTWLLVSLVSRPLHLLRSCHSYTKQGVFNVNTAKVKSITSNTFYARRRDKVSYTPNKNKTVSAQNLRYFSVTRYAVEILFCKRRKWRRSLRVEINHSATKREDDFFFLSWPFQALRQTYLRTGADNF
jgi:hypothetical protein